MKQVIPTKEDHKTVEQKHVSTSNIYVYISTTNRTWIASKLGYSFANDQYGTFHYAFVNLSKTNDSPSFKANSLKECIKKAMRNKRTIYEFDTFSEFLKWRYKSIHKNPL